MTKRVLIRPVAATQTSRRDGQAEAFRVSFDYEDAAIAQKVVERLASFFIETNARDRGTQADQTSDFLEAQLADARSRLEAQEKKLELFRQRNSGRLPTQMQTNMQAIQNTQMALQAMVESLARDRDRKLLLERLYSDAVADAEVPVPVAVPAPPAPAASSGSSAVLQLPADATRFGPSGRAVWTAESPHPPGRPDELGQQEGPSPLPMRSDNPLGARARYSPGIFHKPLK